MKECHKRKSFLHFYILISHSSFLTYSHPVGLYPAAVRLGVGLYGHEAELGTYPLALAHGEGFAAGRELLAVLAVGKPHDGLAAVGLSGLGIADGQSQVDVLMDGRLIVGVVLGSGLQRGDELFGLRLALVGVVAGDLQQLELVTHTLEIGRAHV